MRITRKKQDQLLELQVEGHLDAYWADHFRSVVQGIIREGNHQIAVNLAQVDYISSAGLGALTECYKELLSIHGTFSIINPSEFVAKVLKKTSLDELLIKSESADSVAVQPSEQKECIELPNADLQVYHLSPDSPDANVVCRLIGNPDALAQCEFEPANCRKLAFPTHCFGIGLGVPGINYDDCHDRFGEFVAVGGAIAYLPTGEKGAPDYLISAEQFVPEIQILHSMVCEGDFSHLICFESKSASIMSMEQIALQSLSVVGVDTIGVVMIAEVDGLIGAALKRSPTSANSGTHLFRHPDIREWITFTTERAYPRSLVIVAGIATRKNDTPLGWYLRPLGNQSKIRGHFHAVVFSYRPLQKGRIALIETVRTIFETDRPQGILHLINDDRSLVGSGQSEFVRGKCWASPVSAVIPETY
ncbi:MAG: STAS domain-containing protein [Planctomycetota bacterium]|nr:MAG: STAS domain-containing protein [Planctomycetota bacterium]